MSVRTCVMTSVHPPFDIRIFHKECKSLANAGHQVTLVAPFTETAQARDIDGIAIRAVPRAKNRIERLTRTVWRVYRKALEQDADVYHFHDPELMPVGLLLRLRGKRVVYDIHEDLPRCMPYKPYLPKWVGRAVAQVVEVLENSASRCFSGLVAATPGIAVRFCRINRRTIVVNNYPLMGELAAMPIRAWQERDVAVTYVGSSINISRGAVEMVQAMGLLPPEFQATLTLAGPFLPASLKDTLAAEPGWRRVRVYGVLDRAGVAEALSCARAGLVVEHPEPNYVAGKPIKMYEYMAAGIPVISSDFPLWRQVVDGAGCGLCVDPLNPQKIADAIQYLLTHPKEAEEMGQRGRKAIIERYNWDREKGKLLNLYGELMNPVERRHVAAAA